MIRGTHGGCISLARAHGVDLVAQEACRERVGIYLAFLRGRRVQIEGGRVRNSRW